MSVIQVHHRQQRHVFFRRGLSFQTQLLCATYHELAKAADEGHTTHAVVMDFKKKAFDKEVPHFLLLQKLQGTPGIDTTFLTGYLISFLIDINPLF